MPRIKSLAVALAAAAMLLVPAASAGAQEQGFSHRLANVPAQTRQTLSTVVLPKQTAIAPKRDEISVFYLCTSRRGAVVTVAPTEVMAPETRRARCDGRSHQMRFFVNGQSLFTIVTLKQGTAARAGFTVWQHHIGN